MLEPQYKIPKKKVLEVIDAICKKRGTTQQELFGKHKIKTHKATAARWDVVRTLKATYPEASSFHIANRLELNHATVYHILKPETRRNRCQQKKLRTDSGQTSSSQEPLP